ncbi:hypothetical protein X953_01160 [Virgibacillus sp. SK37]|nr:hypothetical protein X953_01160 [Virgibacillus sp. SK37]
MHLSLLGISVSLFGIALILTSRGLPNVIGLVISFVGLLVSLVSCFLNEAKKVKNNSY